MLVELMGKSCSNKKCEQVNPQPVENFYKRGDTACGLYSRCKSCCQKSDENRKDKTRVYKTRWDLNNKDQKSQYYKNNREKVLLKVKEYRENNRVKIKDYQLKKYYGITFDQYSKILINQNHKCAICGVDEINAGKKGLFVDHNHNDYQVRGLLCSRCNLMIGYAKENISTLRKAIDYLSQEKENNIIVLYKKEI